MTQLPALVTAIDSSKARFLTLAAAIDPVLDPSPKTIKIDDLNKDINRLTAHEIHQYLAEKDLLPAPQRAGIN